MCLLVTLDKPQTTLTLKLNVSGGSWPRWPRSHDRLQDVVLRLSSLGHRRWRILPGQHNGCAPNRGAPQLSRRRRRRCRRAAATPMSSRHVDKGSDEQDVPRQEGHGTQDAERQTGRCVPEAQPGAALRLVVVIVAAAVGGGIGDGGRR